MPPRQHFDFVCLLSYPSGVAVRWYAWVCFMLVVVASAIPLHATHNLAGQITYRQITGCTYEITLTTYTDPAPAGVDRCTADIEIWGLQGNVYNRVEIVSAVVRNNGPQGSCPSGARMGIPVRGSIKRNTYVFTYTLPGPGTYELRYFDVARINDVTNISNSGAVAFYVQTQLVCNPFRGRNSSPILLNDPLDDACINRLWSHNPGAWDVDGDSLGYELVPSMQYDPSRDINVPIPAPGYRLPDAFGGTLRIDPLTGIITWDTPQRGGIFNFAIKITQYRNGREVGYVIRDMAVFVDPSCINRPPVIDVLADTCIRPGNSLNFRATVTDPDLSDSIYFYLNNSGLGNNGPFSVPVSPAVIVPPVSNFPIRVQRPTQPDPFADVSWNVLCEHIRNAHYQIDWYAHDNLLRGGSEPTLADNKATVIRVIPPAPDTLIATPGTREISLSWPPVSCSNAVGYRIYRGTSGSVADPDTVCCTPGSLQAAGFEVVGETDGWLDTTFVDDNDGEGLPYRNQYCYRVVALFVDPPSGDDIESCPSPDACVRIRRNIPLLTEASVLVTDAAAGVVSVSWLAPDTSEFNGFFRSPFTYRLEAAMGQTNTVFADLGVSFAFDQTTYLHNSINTETTGHNYRVAFLDADGELIGYSDPASTIFLNTAGQDEAIVLSWREFVPWRNQQYVIWRADGDINDTYAVIDTLEGTGSTQHNYTDYGLTVGELYCYYIQSIGSYEVSGLPEPLINLSQRRCDIPIDTVPPCPPSDASINVIGDCEAFTVRYTWERPDDTCAGDLGFYRLYAQPNARGAFFLIATIPGDVEDYFLDRSADGTIAGCYRLTAVDTSGNESPATRELCVDNCPDFELPNVIIPSSGGGIGGSGNGVIRLTTSRSIRSVKFQVWDRWGAPISQSTNPDRLWDGTTRGGNLALVGVYFYLLEITLDNLAQTKVTRTGSITLIR